MISEIINPAVGGPISVSHQPAAATTTTTTTTCLEDNNTDRSRLLKTKYPTFDHRIRWTSGSGLDFY
jgi:hypothetical protein